MVRLDGKEGWAENLCAEEGEDSETWEEVEWERETFLRVVFPELTPNQQEAYLALREEGGIKPAARALGKKPANLRRTLRAIREKARKLLGDVPPPPTLLVEAKRTSWKNSLLSKNHELKEEIEMFFKKKMGLFCALAVTTLVGWTSYSYPPYGDYSLDPGYGATLAPGERVLVRNDNEEGNLQFTLYDEDGNAVDTIILSPGETGFLTVPDNYSGSMITLMVAWEYSPGHFANFDGGDYTVAHPPK